MAEYMGILGILPFLLLLAILARSVARVYAWMRNTGSPAHYSVPLALVTAAGLIHAGFEDWLVAPGSYLCLAFWVCAFLLIDMAPKPGPAFRAAMRPAAGAPQPLRQSTTPV
jgi:O-antigen ligase